MISDNPPQPPRQSAYDQPFSQTHTDQNPAEAFSSLAGPPHRQYGDPPGAIHRTPGSQPASDAKSDRIREGRDDERERLREAGRDLDTQYGVEQQPREGDIAAAVQGSDVNVGGGHGRRLQPGVHANLDAGLSLEPSAGQAIRQDTAADLGRKRREHDEGLREKHDEALPSGRESARAAALQRDAEVDVKGSVADDIVV